MKPWDGGFDRAEVTFDRRDLVEPRFEIRFPLRTGELIMFDNGRQLHGRTEFDPNSGRRYLQGCYIDIDEPRSGYRSLRRRLHSAQTPVEA